MKLKYIGPLVAFSHAEYGHHVQGMVKEYPDDFAEELLATTKRQIFEVIKETPKKVKQKGKKKSRDTQRRYSHRSGGKSV